MAHIATTPRSLTLLALSLAALSGCSQSDPEQAAATTSPAGTETENKQETMPAPAAVLAPVAATQAKVQPTTQPTVSALLPDFAAYTDVNEKKAAFFDFMLEMVKTVNAEVLQERALIQQWDGLSAADDTLQALIEKYRVDATTPEQQKQELLHKVQVIPPSLVLAQGANESAWGTSRFARQGYNFFGQWCFTAGCGLVPKQRNDGASHEVAKFDAPIESVRSYVRNLNSHPTYQKLRDLRSAEIAHQGYATGLNLAAGLEGYSERGMEYVKEIRSMISFNKIDRLDKPSAS